MAATALDKLLSVLGAGSSGQVLRKTSAALGDIGWSAPDSAFSQSMTNNGWCKFPNGLILQWGTIDVNYNETSYNITFPIPFIANCFAVYPVVVGVGVIGGVVTTYLLSKSLTGAVVNADYSYEYNKAAQCSWFALGN